MASEAGIGRPRKIKNPKILWDLFTEYVAFKKGTPIKVVDFVGAQAIEVERVKYVAITMEGFSTWLFDKGVINYVFDYIKNKDGMYDAYSPTVARIKDAIFANNFEGASVGELKEQLIIRQLSIKENTSIDTTANVNILSIDPLA